MKRNGPTQDAEQCRNNAIGAALESKRKEQIVLLDEGGRSDFQRYINSPELISRSLEIPNLALRYLIPKSLLYYAEKPESVRIVPALREKNMLILAVIEQTDNAEKNKYSRAAINQSREMLLKNELMDKKETVSLVCQVALSPHPDTARIISYGVKDEFLNNFFVAREFFNRLEELLSNLGIKYIWGLNTSESYNFFLRVSGRKSLEGAPKDIQEYLLGDSYETKARNCTYKQLDSKQRN